MLRKTEVETLLFSLKAEHEQILFILLTKDGTINRLGSGANDTDLGDLFMGKVKEPIFEQVLEKVPEAVVAEPKTSYRIANGTGTQYELTMMFKGKGKESGVSIRCCESEGPPEAIRDALEYAIKATDPWYRDFKAKAHPSRI